MPDFDLQADGFDRLQTALQSLVDDLDSDRRVLVGTGVSYAVFLEFGTSDMDPKPFFRPVISEVIQKGIPDFIEAHTRTDVRALGDADAVVSALALAIERRIKETITDKGLIDTGTLRASVVAIRNAPPSTLPGEADFDGDDVPERAGRQAASAAITLED